ncbi:MAG: zinc-ribbon and DUF3426 domain-containing protein [Nitrosomonas sp.]|nr:MAG: zinc-ribbon and DUF3426 domain-containing protein [Nitrosomonas sp.]
MALVTVCPDCTTTFRVSSTQLQAHGGDVRCGHCYRVFNGFTMLITVHESAIEHPVQSIRAPSATPSPIAPPAATDSDSHDWRNTPPDAAEFFLDNNTPEKGSHGFGIAVNVLLSLLLTGQLIHHYRTELTIAMPSTRPYFEYYCAWLGCTVPYPQAIELIGIESSELQKNSSRQPEITTLRATIRNHAAFPQKLPALHLLLLNAQEQVSASRIFPAQDYLPEQEQHLQFIAPQQELEIRLDFDDSQLTAMGYRLQLLYPE